MIEIWTEDTGAGYLMMKNIVKTVYGDLGVSVIPHEGNGDDAPTSKGSRGGMLYDLRDKRYNTNVILLMPDMAIDNSDVNESIMKIGDELRFHKGSRKILNVYCFEYLMLSYKNLKAYGAFDSSSIEAEIQVYLKSFKNGSFNREAMLKHPSGIGRKLLTSEYITGEQLGKRLLSIATNKCNIHTKKRNIRGAVIQGNQLGVCWTCDCCKYSESSRSFDCSSSIRNSIPKIESKLLNVVNNSMFASCINQIDSMLYKELTTRYIKNNSNYGAEYSGVVENFLKVRSNAVRFLQYLGVNGTWNYITALNFIRRSL